MSNTSPAELLQRLQKLAVETGALQYGDFTLSSGAKSTFYFDGKRLTYHPEGAAIVGQLVFEALRDAGVEAVGGLTMGADPIAVAVAVTSQLRGKPLAAFSVRKEVKGHGTSKAIEGALPERPAQVAVVEDVITTGASANQAIKAVEERGHRVTMVVAIVDRGPGGSAALRERGYRFTALLRLDDQGRLHPYA